jgi:hypothetical protein
MATKKPQSRQKTGRKPNGQFAAGVSGNPGGRPKTKQFAEAARKWLASDNERAPHLSNAEALVEFLGNEALGGEIAVAGELIEYAEGKPRQPIDINEDERARKTRIYGVMVERVIERARTEGGQEITREKAIELLAAYEPEIKNYITD